MSTQLLIIAKRKTCFLLAFLLSLTSFGSSLIVVDSINTIKYPEVKFTINLFNPDPKSKTAFRIQENGKPLDFEFERIQPQSVAQENKVLLILLEDMCEEHHPGQKTFFQNVLINSIDDIVNPGDKVNIAVFDRSREGEPVVHTLLSEYTDNINLLSNTVSNFKSKDDLFYNQQSSDLYYALFDGVNEIKDKFPGKKKVVLLLSAGKNNEWSSEATPYRAIDLAFKNRIPVYSIQYRMQGWEHNRLTPIVVGTFGKEIVTNNLNEAVASVRSFINESLVRLNGQTYLFSFQSEILRDGRLHQFILFINEIPEEITFQCPRRKFLDFFRQFPEFAYPIASAAFIIIILITILIILKSKRNIKRRRENEIYKQDSQAHIELQMRELEEIKRKNRERERIEMERKELHDRQTLLSFMHSKGQIPKLIITSANKQRTYNIIKIEVLIGKNPKNDIVIDHSKVSDIHAKLIFQKNGEFVFHDLGSTEGISINGTKISEKQAIRHNDIIKIGDTTLLFMI